MYSGNFNRKMSARHWGEPSNTVPDFIPDIKDDIEKAMDKFCLSEFDTGNVVEPRAPRPIILTPQDPLVLHAISLHKYMNHMTEIIRLAELAIEANLRPSEDAAPPIPPLPDVALKHRINCLNFIPKEETDFTLGKEVDIPFLSEEIVRKVLRKSICTLLGHIGYESTHESLLNILVDVLKEFYRKICHKLEIALHDEKEHNASGFPHVIERVLVDLGMGGVKGLHDYYQSRVIKYINVLYRRCEELKNHYDNLLSAKNPSPITDISKMLGLKIEKEDIDENPEVHLLDGEIELSSLETGFQLLNSLEAEANLHNLAEGDEEMLTTESPGNISLEPDFSPFAKRKKT